MWRPLGNFFTCILATIFLGCIYQNSFAQNNTFVEGEKLKVGDKVPDLTLGQIYNNKGTNWKLSTFSGKLIILDFWNTHCAPCVGSLPKMDSLQKEFKDNIQIIPVTEDPEEMVAKLLNRRWPGNSALKLPFVVNDSIFIDKFFYGSVPHEVWINGEGNIIAITDHEEVTRANIQKALLKEPMTVKMKKQIGVYKFGVPLFLNENNNTENLLYLSGVSRRPSNVRTGSGLYFLNEANTAFVLYVHGFDIRSMYLKAIAKDKEYISSSRVILENIKDPSKYYFQGKNSDVEAHREWMNDNLYCYELVMPVEESKSIFERKDRSYKIMLRDLNAYFGDLYGLSGHMEKRQMKCLVVSSNKNVISSTGGKQEEYIEGANTRVWKNQPLGKVINSINSLYSSTMNGSGYVILDETNYSGNIDLRLTADDIKNIGTMNKILNQKGLNISEDLREIDVVILKESNQKDSSGPIVIK